MPGGRRDRIHRYLWEILLALSVALYLGLELTGYRGSDFVNWLAAGRLVLEGHAPAIYEVRAQLAVQEQISGHAGAAGPFNYPPLVALLFAPLALLPPLLAYLLWVGSSLTMLGILAIRQRMLLPARTLLAVFCFAPLYESIAQGQLTLPLFAAWLVLALAWRRNQPVVAGIALSVALLKPPLALPLAVALLADRRFSVLVVAAAATAAGWLVALPFFGRGELVGYLGVLRLSATSGAELGFRPDRMENVRGLLSLLGVSPGIATGIAVAVWLGSLATLAWMWWRGDLSFERRLAVTVALAVVTCPHLYPHDLTFLLLGVLALLTEDPPGSLPEMRWLLPGIGLLLAGMWLAASGVSGGWAVLVLGAFGLAGAILFRAARVHPSSARLSESAAAP